MIGYFKYIIWGNIVKKFILSLASLFFISSCTSSTFMSLRHSAEDLSNRIANSPIIEPSSNTKFEKQRAPEEIEIHYKLFHALNSPNAVINWKRYYVIGEHSEPKWEYDDIADISVYFKGMNDAEAINILKSKASEVGGSAVIDVFKKPLTLRWTTSFGSNTSSTPIYAYAYFGTIVRAE